MPIYKMSGKKNGLQRYKVRINYTDYNGAYKMVERVTYGMAEAQDLLSVMQTQYSKSSGVTNKRITLDELYNEYQDLKKHEIRVSSLNTQDKTYRLRISAYIGKIKIFSITTKTIQEWKNELNNLDLSTVTKQKAYTLLNAIMNYALKMEYIEKNPVSKLDNFKQPEFVHVQEKLRFYTPEQFLCFINYAVENRHTYIDYGCYVFFNIAYFTGMRKGEINALKWTDISNSTIHVRRSIAQKVKTDSGEDIETPPKNKSSYRDIQMPLKLIEILKEHKKLQKQLFKNFSEDYRICGGERCLRDTTIEKYNTNIAIAVGLPHIRVHDFRHSHASLLANNGINIQEIARRLGHANISMTWNTYSHLYPREEERALEILNKIT